MTDPFEIRFGTNDETFLSLQIMQDARPDSDDFWDGNWLAALVEVKVEGFSGRTLGNLRRDEIHRLGEHLHHAYHTLAGEVNFATMEGWLEFVVKFHLTGQIDVTGFVKPHSSFDIQLQFQLDLDQSYLPSALSQIRHIVKHFPIVGQAP